MSDLNSQNPHFQYPRTTDGYWILAVDPGLRALGWALRHSTQGFWRVGVLRAGSLISMGEQIRYELEHIPKAIVRFVEVFVYEDLPAYKNIRNLMTLQATVGLWMMGLIERSRFHASTQVRAVPPGTWKKHWGFGGLKSKDKKALLAPVAQSVLGWEPFPWDATDAILIADWASTIPTPGSGGR